MVMRERPSVKSSLMIASHKELNALIEKEGAHYPFLAQRFWENIAEPGYRISADVFGRQISTDPDNPWDAQALAAVIVGSIVNYRRGQWTFGQTPLGIDDDRLVKTLARLIDAAAHERS